ncbi:hypothetical protein PsYK624_064830 [Phanerochaete sordida]|uniref:Fibronectin type-III domain-containing protein n=1 Tax=Phanerochaete sordida TaxID=48140 RepID=A0A9P3G6U3_9APHY|nr:hypothetical protein PsYK624_064830 [Phanerochaete sordida]
MLAHISTLLVLSAAFAGSLVPVASAAPAGAALQARDFYAPSPTLPDASTVWTVGQQGIVAWDQSKVPSTATDIPWVDLYKTSPYGSAEYVTTLASDVDPQPGQVSVEVPDVAPDTDYFVMVGAWGQSSTHFEIIAA